MKVKLSYLPRRVWSGRSVLTDRKRPIGLVPTTPESLFSLDVEDASLRPVTKVLYLPSSLVRSLRDWTATDPAPRVS